MDGWNGMKPTSAKLTYDDFVNFPDDGLRHELIDGEPVGSTLREEDLSDPVILQPVAQRVGVREYWIVDPDRRTVVKYVRSVDGAFAAAPTLEAVGEGELTSALLPGFSLHVNQLFRSLTAAGD